MPPFRLTDPTVAKLQPTPEEPRLYVWDTEVRGFGLVIGLTRRTFVVRGRVNGRQLKETIGVLGQPDEQGQPWNVLRARQNARRRLGAMSSGRSLAAERARAVGPTLRAALELHVSNMKKSQCSPRSIDTIEAEIPRLLAGWMDRPIIELTRSELRKLHDELTSAGKKYLANRIVAQVSAVWNALDSDQDDGLPRANPAKGLKRNRYTPKRERVADSGLADWYEKVQTLTGVRRDLQLFALFTGMRSEAARHVRWEHVDEDRGALVVPKPKGGESKAFTLPLAPSVLEMLRARKAENAREMKTHDGDHGWVFPSLSRARGEDGKFAVQALAEPKEYKQTGGRKGPKEKVLPGLHTLRRTYLSVATEAGVSELDRHVLANHAYGRQSVNATYIEQAFEHLASCQAKIEAALWERLKPSAEKRAPKARAA